MYHGHALPPRIVLATGNAGKVREMNHILGEVSIEVVPQSAFKVPEAEETGLSFVENAILKARNAATHTGLPALADDSGLSVDALHGAPGIYSARFAGADATDSDNLQKLLHELRDVPKAQRSARFHCAIAFMLSANDPVPLICQASWEGQVLFEPRGRHGFGYDPLFYVPTHDCASAELPPEVKNKISHRGQALQILLAALRGMPS